MVSSWHVDASRSAAADAPGRGPHVQDRGQGNGHSVNTIAFHMKSVYAKLQVHSKSEAVAKALRTRIVR